MQRLLDANALLMCPSFPPGEGKKLSLEACAVRRTFFAAAGKWFDRTAKTKPGCRYPLDGPVYVLLVATVVVHMQFTSQLKKYAAIDRFVL